MYFVCESLTDQPLGSGGTRPLSTLRLNRLPPSPSRSSTSRTYGSSPPVLRSTRNSEPPFLGKFSSPNTSLALVTRSSEGCGSVTVFSHQYHRPPRPPK